jgi:hypothetical protein
MLDNEEFDCKCYIQRGAEKIWENFEGNRHVALKGGELAISFNSNFNSLNTARVIPNLMLEQYWNCVVCKDLITNPPIMRTEEHVYHSECFEPYLAHSFLTILLTFLSST